MYREIWINCMTCGLPFGQPPSRHSGLARHYECPACRRKATEAFKRSPARDAGGIYHGIRRRK